MNEREVQAFLSGLPKHVPQRTAKFRAGQIISDSMHGLSGVGVVENGRVDIYAVALDGRDVQLNSIGAGECFGICNLLVAEPLQTVLRCAEETTVRLLFQQRIDVLGLIDSASWAQIAALDDVPQHGFQRFTVLFIQAKREKRHHGKDHKKRRHTAGQRVFRQKEKRYADERPAAEADKLPLG